MVNDTMSPIAGDGACACELDASRITVPGIAAAVASADSVVAGTVRCTFPTLTARIIMSACSSPSVGPTRHILGAALASGILA